jgi:predicted transcriptional regulator
MTRRTKIEIVFDLLSLMQKKGGKVKPTHALYGGNLSYDRLKLYVEEMQRKGLIIVTQEKKRTFYEITEQGHHFVSEYKKVKELTDAFGL